MIVEMSYDFSKESGWRWIPRNVRYDKTTQLRRGESQFGNDFNTANNIWKTYHNPLTTDLITGKNTEIPDELEEDTRYYARLTSRDKSLTKPLLHFHNQYVKNNLISQLASQKEGGALLDLSCGKAGDLWKWQNTELDLVVGIDISQDNIENIRDGACARYFKERQKMLVESTQKILDCYFLVGDSSLDISSGACASSVFGDDGAAALRGVWATRDARARYMYTFGRVAARVAAVGSKSQQRPNRATPRPARSVK